MLDRDEYVEQAYFFRVLGERLRDNVPMQELFRLLQDEVLSTTNLPLAINYMLGELKHSGCFGPAMAKLDHYFTDFQTYVIRAAEQESGRFDMRVAISILHHLAEFLAGSPTPQAVFLYQFEVLCRNRLGYEAGLDTMAAEPLYSEHWRKWIREVRRQIGIIGLAELIYVRSEYYQQQRQRNDPQALEPETPILFDEKEGKISLANRRKDPLLLFAALQRQLGYPKVPRQQKRDTSPETIPLLIRRIDRLEQRIKLLEEEQQGGIDITRFYGPRVAPTDDDEMDV